VIAAATVATKPSPIGVENCWSCPALLRAVRVRRNERRELGQHSEERRWQPRRVRAWRGRTCAEQDSRRLADVIGGLPGRGALAVRVAEGSDHCGAKRMHIDGPVVFEIGEEQFGGCDECCADLRCRNSGRGGRRGGGGGRGEEQGIHGGYPGEPARDESRGALLTPAAQPVPAVLSLSGSLKLTRAREFGSGPQEESPAQWPGSMQQALIRSQS